MAAARVWGAGSLRKLQTLRTALSRPMAQKASMAAARTAGSGSSKSLKAALPYCKDAERPRCCSAQMRTSLEGQERSFATGSSTLPTTVCGNSSSAFRTSRMSVDSRALRITRVVEPSLMRWRADSRSSRRRRRVSCKDFTYSPRSRKTASPQPTQASALARATGATELL